MIKESRLILVVTLICVAHVLGMVPFAVYPTLIPTLQVEWGASNTEIGWVAGVYFGGYLLGVFLLVPLTDRIDARLVYLCSMTLTILAALGFAFLNTGVATASFWRLLQGVGLAGTYMPGLKALVDTVPYRFQSRTVAVYTMCFGVGVAVSFLVAGSLANFMTWQWNFAASSVGALVALAIAFVFLPHSSPLRSHEKFRLLPDLGPVFRNRKAIGFSIAYSVHNMELFVFRSWTVTFLVFAASGRDALATGSQWNPAFIVACATLLAQPFSVIVNEIAGRLNRVKVILTVMGLAALTGILLGFSSQLSMIIIVGLVCLYAILSISDSASISSAVIMSAQAEYRGATMAVHALVGFIGAFVGPIIFGVVLDVAGGSNNPYAWGTAFVVMAIFVLIGPLAILRMSNSQPA